jgi:hypothetical protein
MAAFSARFLVYYLFPLSSIPSPDVLRVKISELATLYAHVNKIDMNEDPTYFTATPAVV